MSPLTIYWKLIHQADNQPDPAGLLSPREAERYASFQFAKRREEWLLGRQAAKSLVQRLPGYSQWAWPAMEIINLPEGAPRLSVGGKQAALRLSISHRQEAALCAAIPGAEVGLGVDLERIETRSPEFIRDYFTQAECDLVDAHPAEQQAAAATLIWSAKEAMLKALEVGLRWDTRRVELIRFDGGFPGSESRTGWQTLTVRCPAAGKRHWLAWWQRRDGYVLTIAALQAGSAGKGSFVLVES
jgi:4'-phosphopantetheinyl transferase